jgi:hypothetical protein
MKDPITQAKKAINNLIDVLNNVPDYENMGMDTHKAKMCEMYRRHGLEMAIDEIRRTCLNEWPTSLEMVTYEKYDLELTTELK